jgi:alpha-D-xyloside xylohydrolase
VQTTHTPEKELAGLSTGSLKAELCTAPDAFNVDFIGDGKKLTDIGFNSVQYGAYRLVLGIQAATLTHIPLLVTDSLHSGRTLDASYTTTTTVEPYTRAPYGPTGQTQPYMAVSLGLQPGEQIYGLGERFTPFVKNGQSVDIWHEDGGTDSPIGYKNIPFYLSSKGYGVFVDSTDLVSFEVQSERMDKVQVAVRGEAIRILVIHGPSPKAILERYTAILGRPPIPPAWSFGLWLTTSFTTMYDESTVTTFVDGLKKVCIQLKTADMILTAARSAISHYLSSTSTASG